MTTDSSLKTVSLPIREFAVPVPRVGSIEAHSGYGRALEGMEIHLRVQARRRSENPDYEAEVPISGDFEREGYLFRIGGRMDGLFRGERPRIEEIKSGANIWDLAGRLREAPLEHPYGLQLLTYGYLYELETGIEPDLNFHLASARTTESMDLLCPFPRKGYEAWLEARLDELVEEVRRAERRAARRRKVAENFPFPFEKPRPGQLELIEMIQKAIDGKATDDEAPPESTGGCRMLLQAPTGLGKTAGVLYPVLKDALGRGQRAVYVTPKNSQHLVAEDAVERFQEAGAKLKSLSITAKAKICFKNEPLCNPKYCEYAKDYYEKVDRHKLLEALSKKKKLRARTFRKMGEEFEVCPFELQLDSAVEADLVICDYNYVFSPRSAFGRLAIPGIDQDGKPNLVIDEAHNLPSRTMDYFSPRLSGAALDRMRADIRELPSAFREEAEELLDECLKIVLSCAPGSSTGGAAPVRACRIIPPVDDFIEHDESLRGLLSRYLESEPEIAPRDVVLRLCFYWSEFTDALQYISGEAGEGRKEFFATFQPALPHQPAHFAQVRITCCDASELIKDCYGSYEHAVGFSATLKPFDYYAKLAGLDPGTVQTAEFRSPFPPEHRKLLIIPQISTKYSERERNYPRIADAIARIAAVQPGNYFAFFPSFEFLERVCGIFNAPPGFEVLRQERDMKAAQVEELLERLRENSTPTVIFAVQGGVFSEGVDYPGRMIIGAFVVGPPLPSFELEREEMRAYYEKEYGDGFAYAYSIPAMAKAVQAAGRVIRSESDRGLIVLMDNRFLQPGYAGAMPSDWFSRDAGELVSGSILQEVRTFWDGQAQRT